MASVVTTMKMISLVASPVVCLVDEPHRTSTCLPSRDRAEQERREVGHLVGSHAEHRRGRQVERPPLRPCRPRRHRRRSSTRTSTGARLPKWYFDAVLDLGDHVLRHQVVLTVDAVDGLVHQVAVRERATLVGVWGRSPTL